MNLLLALALSLTQYRAALERIDAQLGRGETAAAAAEATRLLEAQPEGLGVDRWTLEPIAHGEPRRARLRALLDALSAGTPKTQAIDPDLLRQLEEEDRLSIPKGGSLDAPALAGESWRERIAGALLTALDWAGQRIEAFLRWLFGGEKAAASPAASGSQLASALGLGVLAILLLVIGLAVSAARSKAAPSARRGPRETRLDDDPLSRTVEGWEARARELAAEGRAREAIRAWYHALLVRCYAAGVLHYQRGRTNWEYARALPPQLRWRDGFEELTRRFDLEWYGRAESSAEALRQFGDGASRILRELGSRR